MSYSTVSMVRLALVPSANGSLPTTVTHTAADLSDSQIQDAIAEADATIDSYISKFYAVPVAVKITGDDTDGAVGQIPHPIDFWSRNIAAYNATLTYRGAQDVSSTDPIYLRWQATITALQQVAAGRATLQLPGNVTDNAGVLAGSAVNPYVGDLWQVSDFDLRPPFAPGHGGYGYGPYWR